LLFVAGLLDDLFSLGPIPKLGAQVAAAGIVVANGATISGLISNDLLADVVAVVWLVGLTNAFNLLDNMDGLAATLAGIAAVFSAALGTTSLFYAVLDNGWVTLIGVLLTFALLVQFASVLSDVERAPGVVEERGWLHTFVANPRRLVESVVDFTLVAASFLFA